MTQPITRKPVLTAEQAARLDETGEVEATIRKAPWYYPLMEHSAKFLLAACAGMALYIFNGMTDGQHEQAKATQAVADRLGELQTELVRQRTQIEAMTESMHSLSTRQDSAIATAERAMAEQSNLRSRVELLQYYVLEFDGKLIAAGLVKPVDSVALKLRKQEESKQ